MVPNGEAAGSDTAFDPHAVVLRAIAYRAAEC